jgi:histidinol-phosphatase (PHP family)
VRCQYLNRKSDNHTHILFDPLDQMIEGASQRGIRSISITEHISQIKEIRASVNFGSTHSSGRVFQNIDEYLQEFSTLQKYTVERSSVNVRKGLEVDYIPGYEKEISRFVNSCRWDIILRSVHELSDGKDIEAKFGSQSSSMRGNRWTEYVGTEIALARNSEIPFDVLTHPVRLAVGTPVNEEALLELLQELAEACRIEKRAIELNGKDLTTHPKLVTVLAKACSQAGCLVSFGSDAHHPKEIARGYERARELAENFNLNFIA